MKTTHQLSHFLEYDINPKSVFDEVKEWIDSNMMMADQNHVWNIGISTSSDIVQVSGQIRNDLECKHFKYWNAESFKAAINIISRLNCYPFIFKSCHNAYQGKGRYVFVYKSRCKAKRDFYHTLNS